MIAVSYKNLIEKNTFSFSIFRTTFPIFFSIKTIFGILRTLEKNVQSVHPFSSYTLINDNIIYLYSLSATNVYNHEGEDGKLIAPGNSYSNAHKHTLRPPIGCAYTNAYICASHPLSTRSIESYIYII